MKEGTQRQISLSILVSYLYQRMTQCYYKEVIKALGSYGAILSCSVLLLKQKAAQPKWSVHDVYCGFSMTIPVAKRHSFLRACFVLSRISTLP